MGAFFQIKRGYSEENLLNFIKTNSNHLFEGSERLKVYIEPHGQDRSLSQNALYWQWVTLICKHFKDKGYRITYLDEAGKEIKEHFGKDDIHHYLATNYLGLVRRVLKGRVSEVPRSTASLVKGEMFDYMEKVDNYARDRLGLILPHPEDSEYMKLMEIQNR